MGAAHLQSNEASGGERPRRRPRWGVRAAVAAGHLLWALGALWLGMSVPAYFRSISPLVLQEAGAGTPTLPRQALAQLEAGRPGPASLLLQATRTTDDGPAPQELQRAVDALLAEHPAYHWSGGPAPFYEMFLARADHLRADQPAVIPTLLPAEHRRWLLAFLRESPSRNVRAILDTRELSGWERFYPVHSTSGHPLEAAILCTALLEQSGALADGLRTRLLGAVPAARAGDPQAMGVVEAVYLGILTLGRHTTWLSLEAMLQRLAGEQELLFAAHALQEDPARLPLLFAGLLNAPEPEALAQYLLRHGARGWDGLAVALGYGRGAVALLLRADKPVYQPPRWWDALPAPVRDSQHAFKGFAEALPGAAIGLRALGFGLCGYFLVGILRALVLGVRPERDRARRLLLNLDSLTGAALVMALVWILIEPGLLEFQPNRQGVLRIKLAEMLPQTGTAEPIIPPPMIDQATILVLLLFFVGQLLVFIFGLLKIAEIKRHEVPPAVKLHLLENEEVLFDLGLYVGLGGTVAALILVVLNLVDASLMAAYASTLFGILFVAILKIGFVRPFRRRLILAQNAPAP